MWSMLLWLSFRLISARTDFGNVWAESDHGRKGESNVRSKPTHRSSGLFFDLCRKNTWSLWVWGFCFEHYDKEKQSNYGEMMCVIAAHKIKEYIVALFWGHRTSLGSPPLDFAARQWPRGLLTRSLIYWTYNRWQTAIGCRKKLIPFWSPYPNVSEGKLFLRWMAVGSSFADLWTG